MSTVLLYGHILAEALNSLVIGFQLAKDVTNAVTDTVQVGTELLDTAVNTVKELIKTYQTHDVRHLNVSDADHAAMKDALQKLFDLIKDKPLTGDFTDEQWNLIMPQIDIVLHNLRLSPMYNPLEWESYEIEPPCNPTFKPVKITEIPVGMDLYEIACPKNFTGLNPQTACLEKSKPKCRRVSQNCKGRKKSKTTRIIKKCNRGCGRGCGC